ncbi:MAG: hypothetical protein HOO86_15180 [Bacteroidales bacterium]|nr:hypothetical protein [Bacteroidales bacterium]
MKKLPILLAILALFVAQTIVAQDIILQKDSTLIKCKIKEIGLDEVKYTLPDYSTDVTLVIDKDNIMKVIFENGKEMTFQKAMTNPANYKDNKKNALKINFLSPLMGSTGFSYERSLKPGRSVEGTIGIIGLGVDQWDENPGGAFVKFGYKFIKDPDFYLRGMRYAHILKGGYIKPEIGFAAFSREDPYYTNYGQIDENRGRENVISAVLQLVAGKQWIMDNAFVIDYFFGVGYGFSTSDNGSYHYGYTVAGDGFPISFTSGLKVGFLFK